jgi:hypothetical protein
MLSVGLARSGRERHSIRVERELHNYISRWEARCLQDKGGIDSAAAGHHQCWGSDV